MSYDSLTVHAMMVAGNSGNTPEYISVNAKSSENHTLGNIISFSTPAFHFRLAHHNHQEN